MNTTEETGFGTTEKDFGKVTHTFRTTDPKEMLAVGGRKVFEEGLICLRGHVHLHTHSGGPLGRPFEEVYTLRPSTANKPLDVRILICSVYAPIMGKTQEEIKELLSKAFHMVPGVKYHCPIGYAHTIINLTGDSSGKDPVVEFVKYYPAE